MLKTAIYQPPPANHPPVSAEQTESLHSAEARRAAIDLQFPPLELLNKPTVPTAQAAYYLSRAPQTLRIWAMTGKVIRPIRINGRLAWPVACIKKLLEAV